MVENRPQPRRNAQHSRSTRNIQIPRSWSPETRLVYPYATQTSHWSAPVYVNGKQPQTYGDDSKKIEYDNLVPPKLDDLMSEIEKLI